MPEEHQISVRFRALPPMNWSVYIVKCSDESLYTGITTDIKSRIERHNQGKGAKSVRGKLPVRLVHIERFEDRGSALKREVSIKKLNRSQKLELIAE